MIIAMATVGEKTWATFTFDNAYTRGITKTFKDTNSKWSFEEVLNTSILSS